MHFGVVCNAKVGTRGMQASGLCLDDRVIPFTVALSHNVMHFSAQYCDHVQRQGQISHTGFRSGEPPVHSNEAQ